MLVTGAAGLLGSAVVAAFREAGRPVLAYGHHELDVTDPAAVRARVRGDRPSTVVHCAAFTQVDRAEDEPERAWAVNRDGTRAVAQACAAVGARLLYLSTDFVFDGQGRRPYRPDDPTAPLGVYGASKRAGEEAVRAEAAEWAIVRTSWLYGPGGRNFVDAILDRATRGDPLRVVADQRGRPTYAPGLAQVLRELAEREVHGVWHVADGGEATWWDLAQAACRRAGLKTDIEPVTTAEWGAAAPRPAYSVLDTTATEHFLGRSLPQWQETLDLHVRMRERERVGSAR